MMITIKHQERMVRRRPLMSAAVAPVRPLRPARELIWCSDGLRVADAGRTKYSRLVCCPGTCSNYGSFSFIFKSYRNVWGDILVELLLYFV